MAIWACWRSRQSRPPSRGGHRPADGDARRRGAADRRVLDGPDEMAPGITIREIGWDFNVFNEPEAEGPKDDFVLAATPDVAMFSRLRFFKISAYAGADMNVLPRVRIGAIDRPCLSRPRRLVAEPLAAVRWRRGSNKHPDAAQRRNRRPRRSAEETELSGGVAFDVQPEFAGLCGGGSDHERLQGRVEGGRRSQRDPEPRFHRLLGRPEDRSHATDVA